MKKFWKKETPALPLPPPFGGQDPSALHFRRAVGLTIKVYLDRADTCDVHAKRHGQQRQVTLDVAGLRSLMALDAFRQHAEPSTLAAFERDDLIYYSRAPVDRPSTGAPLQDHSRKISLRRGVNVTLAVADADEIVPWLFMPRRGSLNDKTLVGARFASIEDGSEAYVLDLLGAKKHGAALRDLLPLLDGRHDWAALAQSGPLAERLLAWLDAAALLEANDETFAAPFPQSHVTWLGHAAVLVKVGAATIAVDPLFFTDSAPRRSGREALPDPRALPVVDAIAITHGDNDHLNPHSLARFSRDTPIIIPRCREARPYQVDIEAVVRFLGFTDVRTLGDWESVAIKDVQLTAAPFVGEDWGLQLAKATYVVSGPSGAVYLTADAAAMPEVWRQVAERFSIDVAFLGISGCEEPLICPPGFGYGEFYALWLERARRNEWQRLCAGPAESAEAVRVLHPRYFFGYAAGGGSFMDMAHSDRGSHEELGALVSESAAPAPLALAKPFDFSQTRDR